MLLNEFFGKAIDASKPLPSGNSDDKNLTDRVFWFIIDHDKLHKDFFIPIATKVKKTQGTDSFNKEKTVASFMPMVERGCLEYYQTEKLKGSPGKLFPKDFREELCERLFNHYFEDIIKDQYNLGQ